MVSAVMAPLIGFFLFSLLAIGLQDADAVYPAWMGKEQINVQEYNAQVPQAPHHQQQLPQQQVYQPQVPVQQPQQQVYQPQVPVKQPQQQVYQPQVPEKQPVTHPRKLHLTQGSTRQQQVSQQSDLKKPSYQAKRLSHQIQPPSKPQYLQRFKSRKAKQAPKQ
ncbi:alpha/beta-gliadin MM1 isoform X1 [Oryzias melastigma]|uniref:alpha/beta-gliadin MM1 isoform X1 n=1 Tax=Oryzias melastigma TaxID=30732 RepID=UPI00168D84C4|nr:alpha/beta-gliadin MM1 isoform X1 [Oryzias melastigma]